MLLFPCLPQPLPAYKQEARLGSLPGPRLEQEAQETSLEDSPQYKSPWEKEMDPAPSKSSPRGRTAWAVCTPHVGQARPNKNLRAASVRAGPHQDPPLRTQVTKEAGWSPRGRSVEEGDDGMK